MMSWLGITAYTFQIYFDFSGYSDMAIGLGLMFGFHFEENFNYPYMASSISEFWHRWHISLSTWFRDYVYIPMGGNRVNHSRWLLNVFTVWLLTGIWHGANWTFILWGLFYFVLLVFERETGIKPGHFITMFCVMIAWVIFRSDSITSGISYIASLFGLNGNNFCDSGFFIYIKSSWLVIFASLLGISPVMKNIFSRHKFMESLWLCFVFIISTFEVISSSYNPFIYFNF